MEKLQRGEQLHSSLHCDLLVIFLPDAQIGPALLEYVKPVVPEEPTAEGSTGNGDPAGINAWDADPEQGEAGKGKQKSESEKEAKKLLKKRAKQLQREAAVAQQGTPRPSGSDTGSVPCG